MSEPFFPFTTPTSLTTQGPRVRFAPSPTGLLHLGNARSALFNYLYALAHKGTFILRIDDTDLQRSQEKYTTAIKEDLIWLGLTWDEYYRQSQRLMIYQKAVMILKEKGLLYACYESPQELEVYRAHCAAKGKPPIYREALGLCPEKNNLCPQDAPVHWRLRLTEGVMTWNDAVLGAQSYDTRHLSDPILVRSDGTISYILASVVDDGELKIDWVLRGADHCTNTAVQIQLFHNLGYQSPQWAHFSLLTDEDKEKLSKRTGSISIQGLRQDGFLPFSICQTLVNTGAPWPLDTYDTSMMALAQRFTPTAYSTSSVAFSFQALENLQKKALSKMSYSQMRTFSVPGVTPQLWDIIRTNIARIEDAKYWVAVCAMAGQKLPDFPVFGGQEAQELGIAPKILGEIALAALPIHPWNEESWSLWLEQCQETLEKRAWKNISKKALSLALRYSITGKTNGPKMSDLMPLIGESALKQRLKKML